MGAMDKFTDRRRGKMGVEWGRGPRGPYLDRVGSILIFVHPRVSSYTTADGDGLYT